VHFVLTHVHPRKTFRSITHPKIVLGQARLTLRFFRDKLPKKVHLVGMNILSILLSLGPLYNTTYPCQDITKEPVKAMFFML
jgi:hypothetical protein